MEDVYVAQKFQDPKEASNVRTPVMPIASPFSISHHIRSDLLLFRRL